MRRPRKWSKLRGSRDFRKTNKLQGAKVRRRVVDQRWHPCVVSFLNFELLQFSAPAKLWCRIEMDGWVHEKYCIDLLILLITRSE
jgi:hypothetical protein